MPARFPLSPVRRVLRLLAICGFGWFFWTGLRSRHLLRNTKALAQQSQQWPHDYYVGNPHSPPFTYCVLGDSTAVGCGAQELAGTYPYAIAQAMAARGYRVHVLNFAVIGARLSDVHQHQLSDVATAKPNLISVSIGANDATHFTSLKEYNGELKSVLATLAASSATTILFANTPDMYLAPALPLPLSITTARRARRQNGILNRQLMGSRIRVVDLFGRGKLDYHRDKSLYASDLFHPSSRGYAVWARLFTTQMASHN